MKFDDISEGVAGPQKCWPGHRKIGTQPGTGKNAGKRVNKCKKIGEGLTDDVADRDVGEYDREGEMAMGQLKTAEDAAAELRSILDSDENLPEWVQSKITKAVDYLDTARDYMKSKEEQDVTEVSSDTLKSYQQKVSADSMKHPSDPTKRRPEKASRSVAGFAKAQKRLEKGVAEGEGKTQKYEMMMRNGQVKKFIAKDDADAKRIAAGHGAKSVIRLKGGVPAGKVSEQGVAEANYYNPMDQERREQDAMDYSKKSFKRQELDFEFQRERELEQQRKQAERGPWYLRIDGKVYRQKGQPKAFDWKKGANNYALAMIKNNPALQGKIMLTKKAEDQ